MQKVPLGQRVRWALPFETYLEKYSPYFAYPNHFVRCYEKGSGWEGNYDHGNLFKHNPNNLWYNFSCLFRYIHS